MTTNPDGRSPNYLNRDYGWKSWLFTKNHKRIATDAPTLYAREISERSDIFVVHDLAQSQRAASDTIEVVGQPADADRRPQAS